MFIQIYLKYIIINYVYYRDNESAKYAARVKLALTMNAEQTHFYPCGCAQLAACRLF